MKTVGNGCTFALSTDGTVGNIQSMDMPTWSGEDVDVSDLDSSEFMEFLYGGLADGGEASLEVFIDPAGASLPTVGLVQTATIVITDGTTTRTITGSGYVREFGMGNATPGEAIVGPLVFKFDGVGTPPSIGAPEPLPIE